ncbi:lipase family protein [Robbsia andropogonis]|uniref:lipase family protein n=2 Tax=Robbsia andropogonis TaxID=28092 RepID=UPI00209DA8FD|nr:lipase [Robbsia andropogonis]MCP1121625.1 lipase [Robbsia andropogonis]MCP1131434.1 lipase [Robbsia andropogonis]
MKVLSSTVIGLPGPASISRKTNCDGAATMTAVRTGASKQADTAAHLTFLALKGRGKRGQHARSRPTFAAGAHDTPRDTTDDYSKSRRTLANLRALLGDARPLHTSEFGTTRQNASQITARGAINPAQINLVDKLRSVETRGEMSSVPDTIKAFEGDCPDVLECMRMCAGEAYAVTTDSVAMVEGLTLCTNRSTAAMKVWEATTHPDTLVVVFGFAGTRMTDMEDIRCDLNAQITQKHRNPLGDDLPSLGAIGSGWLQRWHAAARAIGPGERPIVELLEHYAHMARKDAKTLRISIAGHSLGAAVGTLAGFDIATFLRTQGVKGSVSAYAFNPPRLGPEGIGATYRNAWSKAGDGTMDLTLRQLTRSLDPIQSLPMFMEHPHWSGDVGGMIASHSAEGLMLYTYNDSAVDRLSVGANHDIGPWQKVIASDMRVEALLTLFGRPCPDVDRGE